MSYMDSPPYQTINTYDFYAEHCGKNVYISNSRECVFRRKCQIRWFSLSIHLLVWLNCYRKLHGMLVNYFIYLFIYWFTSIYLFIFYWCLSLLAGILMGKLNLNIRKGRWVYLQWVPFHIVDFNMTCDLLHINK